jgi:hypothetical protein
MAIFRTETSLFPECVPIHVIENTIRMANSRICGNCPHSRVLQALLFSSVLVLILKHD